MSTPAPRPPGRRFASFAEFYPYYLTEHADRTCRRLHFAGSCAGVVCLLMFLGSGRWGWLGAGVVAGYAFAWIGHYGFEKNRPATFEYPFYSLAGDWMMFRDMLTGRIRF
jgi:hypothetical protein